jgi:hypothetical protein
LSHRTTLTEPLRGWRAWQVIDTRRGAALASWWVSEVWPPGHPLEARCAVHRPRPSVHHVCGILAFSARDEALAYLERDDETPLLFSRRPKLALGGHVSGWGRTVAHERGGRSQFAYPYDLHLIRGDSALARAIASRYAVETSPFPALP